MIDHQDGWLTIPSDLQAPTIRFHLEADDLKKIARAKRRVELDGAVPTQPTLVPSVALDQRDVELFIKEAVRVALERLS